ncbi:helix-turn-helix domain-containing protein [Actinoplanes sp. GCM10030250]|uniref:helix-turn-helix domain-containing protein n=1 Tax=Actinoplanes sp. GCM10030250 TaxID=3273376 RepID=UPI0036215BAF
MHGEPPAVARRRVRFALRGHRQAVDLNQTEVAHRLGWSLSKVQRIESGEVGVSVTDLRALLQVYEVDDTDEIQRLVEDSKVSRRQRWYEAPEYRRHVTKSLRQLLQFESEATAIYAFQPVLVPGQLQTPAFAEAVLSWWKDKKLSDDDRRVRHDVRMLRRRQIFERVDGPDYHLILDESVVMRRTGGPQIMAEQLEALESVSRLPQMRIRVLPLSEGALGGAIGPFQILQLGPDLTEDSVLYRESFNRDNVTHDAAEIHFHHEVFEELWAQCLDEQASRLIMHAELASLRRPPGG